MAGQEGRQAEHAGQRAASWSRYWASGARHSCLGSFAEHYGAATQQFWRERFDELDGGDCILELGCGNGSLIRFLAEAKAPLLPAHIDAVDIAQVDGGWLSSIPAEIAGRVKLHGQTAAGQLPLADGAISCLYSQFAMEYLLDDFSWSELQRVMRPDARIAAVVHKAGSLLHRMAVSEREQIDWMLRPQGLLDLAEDVLPHLVEANRQARGTDANRARLSLNGVLAELEHKAAQTGGDILDESARRVMELLSEARSRGEAWGRDGLAQLRDGLTDGRLRVAELVECAWTDLDATRWTARFRAAGFSMVAVDEIWERNSLFGLGILARRSRGDGS